MELEIVIVLFPTGPGVFVSSYPYIQVSLSARHTIEPGVRLPATRLKDGVTRPRNRDPPIGVACARPPAPLGPLYPG